MILLGIVTGLTRMHRKKSDRTESEVPVMKLRLRIKSERLRIPRKSGITKKVSHLFPSFLYFLSRAFRNGSLIDRFPDLHRSDLMPIPPSELPFKCHLCECSFGERNEALDHIRCQHPSEFQLLVSKGALETNTDEERHQHEDNDEALDSTRGRFPDYANRKVKPRSSFSDFPIAAIKSDHD